MKYNKEIHEKAKRITEERARDLNYLYDCVKADICPSCGEDLKNMKCVSCGNDYCNLADC